MGPFWIIALVVLAIAIGGFLLHRAYERKRTESWRATAADLAIEFLGEANGILSEYGHMKIFQRGRNRKARNAIAGDTGDVRITISDYRYRTGGGKNSKTHDHTICALRSAGSNLPRCYLRPEVRLFDAIGSLFGGQDFDFADDPDFSSAYVLQGDNEEAVRMLFNDDVRAWFAEHKGRNFHFEAAGDALVFHTGKRRKPEEARELMQQALETLNLLAGSGAMQ